MKITFYNSLTNSLEEFKTVKPNEVSMYVCGPTVYNYPHIGNMRPVVVFDTLRRFLSYVGYKVTYVSNFTDVDDKIIKAAQKEGKTEKELTEFYIQEFLKVTKALGSDKPNITPKVTEYIPKIIEYDEVPLFDLVILLICLMLKKHNLTGEIISVPSQVINVMDYMHNKDTSVGTVDTFSFDFDYLTSNKGVQHLRDLQKYLSEDEYTKLMKYIEIYMKLI